MTRLQSQTREGGEAHPSRTEVRCPPSNQRAPTCPSPGLGELPHAPEGERSTHRAAVCFPQTLALPCAQLGSRGPHFSPGPRSRCSGGPRRVLLSAWALSRPRPSLQPSPRPRRRPHLLPPRLRAARRKRPLLSARSAFYFRNFPGAVLPPSRSARAVWEGGGRGRRWPWPPLPGGTGQVASLLCESGCEELINN